MNKRARFEATVLPHLDAAYNLARWLLRHDDDARDAVQEACLRAYRFLDGFRDGNPRSWLLAIVRNTCYSWLQANRMAGLNTEFDEQEHSRYSPSAPDGPELEVLRGFERRRLQHLLEELPLEYREIVILRELEGLSYKEISAVAAIPLGTVMSRLARARAALLAKLDGAHRARDAKP
jgi:RNA polymerase sigma-70 factor (ECF subfamily)